MSAFSSFIISVSAACVLLSALYILCPEGKLKAPIKYTFALTLLCCVCSLGSIGNKIDIDFSISDKYTGVSVAAAEVTAENIFRSALGEEKIEFKKIEVLADKLQDGSISITSVTVYSPEPYEKIVSVIGSDAYEVVVLNE